MGFQSFEDLEVWQRGCRLAVDVFKTFARCRNHTMKDQVQRSALSVPSNVAEGYERNSNKEFNRFLNIAKGSGGERGRIEGNFEDATRTIQSCEQATLQKAAGNARI
jgi:four helix bundle protein